jgi:hypothetical protein
MHEVMQTTYHEYKRLARPPWKVSLDNDSIVIRHEIHDRPQQHLVARLVFNSNPLEPADGYFTMYFWIKGYQGAFGLHFKSAESSVPPSKLTIAFPKILINLLDTRHGDLQTELASRCQPYLIFLKASDDLSSQMLNPHFVKELNSFWNGDKASL